MKVPTTTLLAGGLVALFAILLLISLVVQIARHQAAGRVTYEPVLWSATPG